MSKKSINVFNVVILLLFLIQLQKLMCPDLQNIVWIANMNKEIKFSDDVSFKKIINFRNCTAKMLSKSVIHT